MLQVDIFWIWMFFNDVVQARLREHRLISFVVSVFTVTKQINEYIPVEFLTVFHRDFDCLDHCLYIVSIYMENWGQGSFSNVRTVSRGTCVQVVRCKSYLVVHHDVDCTTGAVTIQQSHLDHFVNDPLTSYRSIPMDHYRTNLVFIFEDVIQFCACNSLNNRIHRLQVRRVWCQSKADLFSVRTFYRARIPLVVLHVTVKCPIVIKLFSFELRENILWSLLEDIRQGVQTTTVCHSHHEIFYSQRRTFVHQSIQCRDQSLTTFNREAFLSNVFFTQESFEIGCLNQLLVHVQLTCTIKLRAIFNFNFIAEPLQTLRLAHEHVLDTDRLAIGFFQMRNDVFQRRCSNSDLISSLESSFQICWFQTKILDC